MSSWIEGALAGGFASAAWTDLVKPRLVRRWRRWRLNRGHTITVRRRQIPAVTQQDIARWQAERARQADGPK